MNINYLISFLEVLSQNNISKAASSLHMTQSALSQQLQSIEKNLNSTLMIRSNKGIELTEEGEIVKVYSETLVNIYENMLKELDSYKKSNISTLKISACSTVGQYMLPCTLHLFKKKHTNVKFNLKIEKSKRVVENILDLSCDVGFIDGDTNNEQLQCVKICSNYMVVVSSPKLKVDSQELSLTEISSFPLILPSPGTTHRGIIDAMFAIGGIKEPNIEMELDSLEAIKASVEAGHGISIIPYSSVKKEIHLKVLQKADIIEHKPSCNISMIYQKKALEKPEIKQFIDYIRRYGKETFC